MKLRYVFLIVLVLSLPWIYNAYKVSQCDFESPYKCEVIHGAGAVVPLLAYITVWFGTDK